MPSSAILALLGLSVLLPIFMNEDDEDSLEAETLVDPVDPIEPVDSIELNAPDTPPSTDGDTVLECGDSAYYYQILSKYRRHRRRYFSHTIS